MNTVTNFNTTTEVKPTKASESEIKARIAAVKNSLSSSKFDPHELTKMYNSITEGRGYSAFSKEGIESWQKEHGHMTVEHVRNSANLHAEAFMKSVHDPSIHNHAKNRERYKNEFNASEHAVKEHFLNKENLDNGRTCDGGAPWVKNTSYENKLLVSGAVSNRDTQAEKQILNSLMQARWNAQGYRSGTGEDDDEKFVQRFYNEYAIALKQSKNLGDGGAKTGEERKATAASNFMAKNLSKLSK